MLLRLLWGSNSYLFSVSELPWDLFMLWTGLFDIFQWTFPSRPSRYLDLIKTSFKVILLSSLLYLWTLAPSQSLSSNFRYPTILPSLMPCASRNIHYASFLHHAVASIWTIFTLFVVDFASVSSLTNQLWHFQLLVSELFFPALFPHLGLCLACDTKILAIRYSYVINSCISSHRIMVSVVVSNLRWVFQTTFPTYSRLSYSKLI